MRGYLAGPMRTKPKFNFPAFFEAARELRADGHEVISPAEHDIETGIDWENEDLGSFNLSTAIMWDLQQIVDSDCIWLLPGWQDSRGCKVEIALAELLNKQIVFLDDACFPD